MTEVKLEDLTANSAPADFEAVLSDTESIKSLVASDKFGQFIKDYADAKTKNGKDILAQVTEQTQLVLAEWLKEHKVEGAPVDLSPEAPVTAKDEKGLYNSRAMGAVLDKEFANSAEYLQTVWHMADRTDENIQAKRTALKNAFSERVPSEGGFLVPERMRAELLRVSLETAIVRPRARVIPMDSLRVPFPAIDQSTNSGSLYGGVTAYWTEESGTLQNSEAKFSRVVLDAKKLTAYTEVPTELITDSAISFEAFVNDIFPEALGWFEDLAFLNGSGVGEPLGVFNGAAKVLVDRNTNSTIKWVDIVAMYARMLPGSLSRSVWIASIDTFPQLATMELSSGSPAVWINNGLAEGPPMTILGRPVIFTEKVPTMGSAGDLSLVDFGYYLLGDRQVMSAKSSEDYRFKNDQTAFRFIERVDGRPWLNSAITPSNGGATLSPIVSLDA